MKIPNVIEPTLTLHEENCKREISKHSEQKMELKTRKNHRNYRPVPAEADLGRKKTPNFLLRFKNCGVGVTERGKRRF